MDTNNITSVSFLVKWYPSQRTLFLKCSSPCSDVLLHRCHSLTRHHRHNLRPSPPSSKQAPPSLQQPTTRHHRHKANRDSKPPPPKTEIQKVKEKLSLSLSHASSPHHPKTELPHHPSFFFKLHSPPPWYSKPSFISQESGLRKKASWVASKLKSFWKEHKTTTTAACVFYGYFVFSEWTNCWGSGEIGEGTRVDFFSSGLCVTDEDDMKFLGLTL